VSPPPPVENAHTAVAGGSVRFRDVRLEVDDVLDAGESTVVLARLIARRHDGGLETHPLFQLWRFHDRRAELIGSYAVTVTPVEFGPGC
jgi:hypothetical protein